MFHTHTPRAFTLIELMVVTALIVILIGLLMPAMSRARATAAEARSLSDLRQVMLGYRSYTVDHRGLVIVGKPPSSLDGEPVVVTSQSGHEIGYPVSDRYPWRLVDYVDNIWGILHNHTGEKPDPPTSADSSGDAFMKAYMLSIAPTYGLNSTYVGGMHGPYGEGFVTDAKGNYRRNTGNHVVFSVSGATRPGELVVFTDAKPRNAGGMNPDGGFFWSAPPHARGERWYAEANVSVASTAGPSMGLPSGRYTHRVVTGFFDGHVSAMEPADLDDMRLWANPVEASVGPDYDFYP